MEPFLYTALPARVVFRKGCRAAVADEVERLGCRRAAVIATPGRRGLAEEIAGLLGERCAGILAEAVMHTPVEVSDKATKTLKDMGADCTVAVGGGSTIGLAKAVALRSGLPQIALPTTYAGSEMTPVVGQTEDGVKTTVRDDVILPKTVLYDVDLTLGLPTSVSATSGMNALAHAIEALYAKERNPVTRLQCLQAIEALAEALPAIMQDPKDVEARSQALFGAFLCGTVLGIAGMALHHKLCHALGGSFDLSHAETHTVVLPHATAFNAPATSGALDEVARILGAEGPGEGLWDLAKRIEAPTSLKAIGMPEDGLERAADVATKDPYWNPRDFSRDDILALLKAAYAGERPQG
ncbi:MAG: maleylacetate reductase [Alphaproteobacteria bacterium]